MSIFKKNPNEKAYLGGKKHFADVIKNTGNGDLLVWRQPEEDFNTNSTLIVLPGEEAVFIKSGKIEAVFANGTYRLSTKNYPFLSRIKNAFTGGISRYNCVVYFVKKALSIEIKWGTDSPIQVRDKKLGIATKLKARGAYKIFVDNAVAFLTKLLGNNIPFQYPQDLNDYFFNEFQSKIRSVIAKALNESEEELLGIDARLFELSEKIKPLFQETLNEYGLKCANFSVSAIDIDDSELRARYDEIGMNMYEQRQQGDVAAQNTIKQGQAEATVKLHQGLVDAQVLIAQGKAEREVMDYLGSVGWSQQQAAEILKTIAANPGGGGLTAAGAGLGFGMAASGAFVDLASRLTSSFGKTDRQNGATRAKDSANEVTNALSKLKELLDMNLIDQEEYLRKKKEILSRL